MVSVLGPLTVLGRLSRTKRPPGFLEAIGWIPVRGTTSRGSNPVLAQSVDSLVFLSTLSFRFYFALWGLLSFVGVRSLYFCFFSSLPRVRYSKKRHPGSHLIVRAWRNVGCSCMRASISGKRSPFRCEPGNIFIQYIFILYVVNQRLLL